MIFPTLLPRSSRGFSEWATRRPVRSRSARSRGSSSSPTETSTRRCWGSSSRTGKKVMLPHLFVAPAISLTRKASPLQSSDRVRAGAAERLGARGVAEGAGRRTGGGLGVRLAGEGGWRAGVLIEWHSPYIALSCRQNGRIAGCRSRTSVACAQPFHATPPRADLCTKCDGPPPPPLAP